LSLVIKLIPAAHNLIRIKVVISWKLKDCTQELFFCMCLSPSDRSYCFWSSRAAGGRQTATGLRAKS